MDAKEEVRSRLAIEDVVGEYVPLKRAGRNWKGLSPFSGEKTPSFIVSPDKSIWHDFSSNQGGDIFSFIMLVEGIDFRATLELLARKAGVDLSLYEVRGDHDLAERKKRLLKLNDTAATYYQRALYASKEAVTYVKDRGFNRQVVHDFRIGYALSQSQALSNFLLKKGYTQTDVKAAGLISGRDYDMFRERMMVPLADGQGQIIGFTARLVRDTEGPKYINTPQTILYDKGRHVFGLHLAKEAIRKVGYAVIVEGNLDVVSSHQANVRQVVATAGTALTEHHLKALSRLASTIKLAFDADAAGIAATERAIPIAQTVGVELSIVSLPEGIKDPDELIQKDASLWLKAIEASQPAIDWIIAQYQKRNDVSTSYGKRQLTTQTLHIVRQLQDPVEREHYLQILGTITGTSTSSLLARLAQLSEPVAPTRQKIIKEVSLPTRPNVQQDYLLALMTCEQGAVDVAKQLQPEELEGDDRQLLFSYLLAHPDGLQGDEVPGGLKDIETYVKIVLLKAETRYMSLNGQDRLVEAVSLVRQIKKQHRTQNKQHLTALLREAEAAHHEAEASRLTAALNALIKEEPRGEK